MEIRKVSIKSINPAAYNPRVDLTYNDPELQLLDKSIAEYGPPEPLVWNCRTGNLVAGHQRLKVLANQGYVEVDTVVIDEPLEREKALNIALNKIRGKWDEDKLGTVLKELSAFPDIDVEITGFDQSEISSLLDRLVSTEDDGFDFNQTLEEIGEPVTRPGDIIELGGNRLLCGDSSKIEDINRLMNGVKCDMVFTDPPYGVSYIPGNRPVKGRKQEMNPGQMIKNDEMSVSEYKPWFKSIVSNVATVLKDGGAIYVWNGFKQFGHMNDVLADAGFHVSNIITWVKPSISISYADYSFQSEFCLYAWKEGEAHVWKGPANESNVWFVNRDGVNTLIHQNQKPLELSKRAIKNSSNRGEVVFDPFLGSGATLISSELLGRTCYGIEIEPKYCDAIVQRYIKLVGKDRVSEAIYKKYAKEVCDGK